MLDAMKNAAKAGLNHITHAPEHLGNMPTAVKEMPLLSRDKDRKAHDHFELIEKHSEEHHSKTGWFGSLFIASPEEVANAKTDATGKVKSEDVQRAKKNNKKYKDMNDNDIEKHLIAEKAIGTVRWGVLDKLVNAWFNFQGGFQSIGSLITMLLGVNLLTGQHVSRRESFAGMIEGIVQLGATAALNQGGAAANMIGQQALYSVILPIIHKFIAGDPQQQQQPAYAYSAPQTAYTGYNLSNPWEGVGVA